MVCGSSSARSRPRWRASTPRRAPVVVVRDDAGAGEQLVAYVVDAEPGAVATRGSARDRAARAARLHGARGVHAARRLPLNASGKLDRKALPAPRPHRRDLRAHRSTRSSRPWPGVFAEVLGLDRIGRDDDFFALGGNTWSPPRSRPASAPTSAAASACAICSARPTVARLAAAVAERADTGVSAQLPVLAARPRPALIPLSPAQQRIWFLNRFDPSAPGYNMPFVVRLRGTADLPALVAALHKVVDRHESLRTVFPAVDAPVARLPSRSSAMLVGPHR